MGEERALGQDMEGRKSREQEYYNDRKEKLPEDDTAARLRFQEFRQKDPFPSIKPALLNSADIFDYVAATGMIYPFEPDKMAGACYEVAIGGPVVWWDEKEQKKQEVDLSMPGSSFRLEPNSIAYVTLEPTFRIPDYMALRFNLKITHVYKGLLLGTGPLVDPGFVGRLSIPLHNLTANTYTFRHGEGMISVEFTKLSPNQEWLSAAEEDRKAHLYKRNWIKPNRTVHDYLDKALMGSKDIMVRFAIPKELKGIRKIVAKTKKEVAKEKRRIDKKLLSIQIVTIFSIVPVLAFACTAIYQLRESYSDRVEQIAELQGKYDNLKDDYTELIGEYDKLTGKYDELKDKQEGFDDIEESYSQMQKQYEILENRIFELEEDLKGNTGED